MRTATADRELAEDLRAFDPSHANIDLHSHFYWRPCLDDAVAAFLDIGAGWDSARGLSSLLSGHTALGKPIAGIERRANGRNWADVLGVQTGRIPNRGDLEEIVVNGRRADGSEGDNGFARARRGLMAVTGTAALKPQAFGEALDAVASGRRPDGRPLLARELLEALTKPRSADVAALLLSFNAAKSLSVALALSRGATRAILVEAHRAGVVGAMRDLEGMVGHIRRGDGGGTLMRASPAWFGCTHFTSRPTWRDNVRIAGDPHLHEHVTLLSFALDESGRAGKLDFAAMHARVAEIGAKYHHRTAAKLREAGIAVSLHPDQDCLRLDAIPLPLEKMFSKRTEGGKRQAESYAESVGRRLDTLTARQRTKLLKLAVQGDPLAPHRDDVADPAQWRGQAKAAGFGQPALIGRFAPVQAGKQDVRIDAAVTRAELILARASPPSPRVAATLAALALMLPDSADIDEVAARLPQRTRTRSYDPLALARAASRAAPFAAEHLRQKAIGGEMRLVPGGRGGVAAVAADLWCARSRAGAIRHPVQVSTSDDVEAIGTEIRSRLLADGTLSRRRIDIPIIGPKGITNVDLRVGEIVVFTSPVNGRTTSGHGRIGGPGTSARVVAFDETGLEIETVRGRAAISWYALSDPAQSAMSLSLGYAAQWPCQTDRAGVAAILEGSHGARRIGVPDDATLLLDLDLERTQRAILGVGRGAAGDDGISEWAIDNLAGLTRSSLVEVVDSVRCSAAILRLLCHHAQATGGIDPARALRACRRSRSDRLAAFAESFAARCETSRGVLSLLRDQRPRPAHEGGRSSTIARERQIRASTSRALPPQSFADNTFHASHYPDERASYSSGGEASAPASPSAVAAQPAASQPARTPPARTQPTSMPRAGANGTTEPCAAQAAELVAETPRRTRSDPPTSIAAKPQAAVRAVAGPDFVDTHPAGIDEDDEALFKKAVHHAASNLASAAVMRVMARRIAAPALRVRLLGFAQQVADLLRQRGASLRRVAANQRQDPHTGENPVRPASRVDSGKRKRKRSRSNPSIGGSDRGR